MKRRYVTIWNDGHQTIVWDNNLRDALVQILNWRAETKHIYLISITFSDYM